MALLARTFNTQRITTLIYWRTPDKAGAYIYFTNDYQNSVLEFYTSMAGTCIHQANNYQSSLLNPYKTETYVYHTKNKWYG